MTDSSTAVEKIVENSRAAREAWGPFLSTLKGDEQAFKEAFHLRPTSRGLTVVSTLPIAPMRGIEVSPANGISKKLQEVYGRFRKIVADDEETALAALEKLGFKERKNKNLLEEDIQAAIIRGMIKGEPCYGQRRFVGSEITLAAEQEGGDRFDIVALQGDTLYITEVKKIRTTKVDEQVNRYLEDFEKERDNFQKLFRHYPVMGAPLSFEKVKGLIIMPYPHNSNKNKWTDTDRIEHWFL